MKDKEQMGLVLLLDLFLFVFFVVAMVRQGYALNIDNVYKVTLTGANFFLHFSSFIFFF